MAAVNRVAPLQLRSAQGDYMPHWARAPSSARGIFWRDSNQDCVEDGLKVECEPNAKSRTKRAEAKPQRARGSPGATKGQPGFAGRRFPSALLSDRPNTAFYMTRRSETHRSALGHTP